MPNKRKRVMNAALKKKKKGEENECQRYETRSKYTRGGFFLFFFKHTKSNILIGQHKLSAVIIPSPHYRRRFFREKVFVWVKFVSV